MEKKRKGALLSAKLVTWVVAILGFLVVLAFVLFYPWGGTIDREACHQSIILRSTFNYGPFEPGREGIPLKCQTEKICLTTGKDCKEFGSPSRKNPVTEIKIKERKDVLDAISNAFYDCNSVLGKGYLNFMPHGWGDRRYGLICSRVSAEEGVQKKLEETGGDVGYLELYNYMLQKQTPNKDSYLKEIYGIDDKQELDRLLNESFENLKKMTTTDPSLETEVEKFKKLTINEWKIDSSQPYVVIAQMTTTGTWSRWVPAGAMVVVYSGLAVTGMVLAPVTGGGSFAVAVGFILSAAKAGAVVSGGLILVREEPNNEFSYVPPTLYPYDVDVLRNLEIYDFAFAP